MQPATPPIPVKNPCPKQWAEMQGDARRRFCDACQLHVHNLSAMSESERKAFLGSLKGPACITYEMLPDGRIAGPDASPSTAARGGLITRALAVLLALLPPALGGCASAETPSAPCGGAVAQRGTSGETEPARVIVTGGI